MAGPDDDDRLVRLLGEWPIVLITPPEVVDTRVVESVLDSYERILTRRIRFVSIVDGRMVRRYPSSHDRLLIARGLLRVASLQNRFNVGQANIASSPFARATAAAIRWLAPRATPQRFFDDVDPAIDWCLSRLTAAAIPVPDSTFELRSELAHSLRSRET